MPSSKNRKPRSPKTAHLPAKTNQTAPKMPLATPIQPHDPTPTLHELAEMRGNEREIDLSTLNRVRVRIAAPRSHRFGAFANVVCLWIS